MRYPLLDPLRGLAAIWVFLHHIVYTYPISPTPSLLQLGYCGVPMFFVISGYCLTAAGRRAVQTGEAPERFLLRRMMRIYPPLWAAIVFTVTAYALMPHLGPALSPFEEYTRQAWHFVTASEWVGIATLTATFRPSGELPWEKFRPVNLVLWTLAIEVQFYAVVWLAVRAGRRFYAVLAMITVASLPFLPNAAAFSSGWFLPFWPFFALGVGLYAALESGRTAATIIGTTAARRGIWWVLLALAGVVAACGLNLAPLLPDGSREMVLGEFAFATGVCAMLWLCWRPPGQKKTSNALSAIVQYLGASSYSLYLLHLPLFLLVGHAIALVLPTSSFAFLVVLVVSVCAGVYPFYRWVEKPCMTSGRSQRTTASEPKTSCVNTAVAG